MAAFNGAISAVEHDIYAGFIGTLAGSESVSHEIL
jgi:hypothetical protein